MPPQPPRKAAALVMGTPRPRLRRPPPRTCLLHRPVQPRLGLLQPHKKPPLLLRQARHLLPEGPRLAARHLGVRVRA